jgi:predicted nucleotidyltransferase
MDIVALPPHLRIDERAALSRFKDSVTRSFGMRVRDLRLFGSRARGEGHEESDVDVLVVIDDLTPEERRAVWAATAEALDHDDVTLGALVMSTAHWRELQARQRLLAADIARDGIPL